MIQAIALPAPATSPRKVRTLEGWSPDPPPHITAETQAIDSRICRRLTCSTCKGRGLEYCPLHLGTRYRVQAVCPSCGKAEEV